jgi:hypothetical protein
MDRSTAKRTLPAPRPLILAGRLVECRVTRGRRRTIAITVDADGLAVRAPFVAPWRAIEKFLAEKARWIFARLDQWRDAPRPANILGVNGETFSVLGEQLRLEVRSGDGAALREPGALVIKLRNPLDDAVARAALVMWLKRAALEAFAPRAADYAMRLGLGPPPVALSSARARWGSCSANGRIRLAWRLVHLAPRLADYVISHEVAHLVEPNHSRRFWTAVESMYPDFRNARRELRLAGATIPLIEGLP